MKNAIDELKNPSILEEALKTADSIPEIELSDATGKFIIIQDILSK